MSDLTESPDYVRISSAAAITLGFKKGLFYRNARTHCINLLETYMNGCKANCAYCGQARDYNKMGECERLIRVEWPIYSLSQIIAALKMKEDHYDRVCVAMITNNKAADDLITIISILNENIQAPISALITPTFFPLSKMKELNEIGTDMITVALDAATESLFYQLRGMGTKGPHKYNSYISGLKDALKIFGKGRVGVHLIVGLGESEHEMVATIQSMWDIGISVHLFSFYPERGSILEQRQPPPIGQYRRIQLARHFIETNQTRIEKMIFNSKDQIIDFSISKVDHEKIIASCLPFETSGCFGCNRPFANERPSEPIRNFPFKPNHVDLTEIRKQLNNYNLQTPISS